MQKESNISHGVKWGLMIGVLYAILVFLRYDLGQTKPVVLQGITIAGFLVVLGLLLFSGFRLRSMQGGYIEIKDIFKVLFVTVLIYEAFYVLTTFVYMKYMNPDFFPRYRLAVEAELRASNASQGKIDELLGKMDQDATRKLNMLDVLRSYLISISISGMFALIFALLLRRKAAAPAGQPGNN